jgi:hypothetical protein
MSHQVIFSPGEPLRFTLVGVRLFLPSNIRHGSSKMTEYN